jgi:hypothetical protein
MNLEKGAQYIIKEELNTLCCNHALQPGEIVEIWNVPSKNRLIILTDSDCLHKVKRSTLNRISEEVGVNAKTT